MNTKFNPSRYNVLFAAAETLPRPSEIEGLMTQRGANSRERVSMQRENSSKGKHTPKVEVNRVQKSAQGTNAQDKKVRSFNQSESSQDAKLKQYCPSHPNKKAKYFLASNTNIGFCTKCAITMSEREDLVDEQKLTKISQIDRFKQSMQRLRDMISHKQQQITHVNKNIQQMFRHEMNQLGEKFEKMFQDLTEKYQNIVQRLQQRFDQANKELAQCQLTLENTSSILDKCVNDISKNYYEILNQQLSIAHFNEIMSQYRVKIEEQTRLVDNCEVRGLQVDHQMEMLELHGMIGRMSFPEKPKRPSLRSRLQNKQNNMNIGNCQKKQLKPCRS